MPDRRRQAEVEPVSQPVSFDPAEVGALAHLYRAEVYRSTMWRTRLDQTTNWSIVSTGIALSLSFASPGASPLPLILVALLVVVFLYFEARRYRYFNVWRARCRVMEKEFLVPLLRGEGACRNGRWNLLLANDYLTPSFHISGIRSIGRRLRKNYAYILVVQAAAYYGKLAIHPDPVQTLGDFVSRAALGPIPGIVMVLAGVVFHGSWLVIAFGTLVVEHRARVGRNPVAGG